MSTFAVNTAFLGNLASSPALCYGSTGTVCSEAYIFE
jgi:hypothetical protein